MEADLCSGYLLNSRGLVQYGTREISTALSGLASLLGHQLRELWPREKPLTDEAAHESRASANKVRSQAAYTNDSTSSIVTSTQTHNQKRARALTTQSGARRRYRDRRLNQAPPVVSVNWCVGDQQWQDMRKPLTSPHNAKRRSSRNLIMRNAVLMLVESPKAKRGKRGTGGPCGNAKVQRKSRKLHDTTAAAMKQSKAGRRES